MELDFKKGNGLLPAIIQDAQTNKVLMLGYMNEESLAVTRETGKVTFFSRSKQRLWTKGETSGNFLEVIKLIEDCDQDTLLIKVDPKGPACHTGSDTCFNEVNSDPLAFLKQLTEIIEDRKENPSDQSYTTSLFKRGINKISQKVGEEAVEVVIEAMDNNKELLLNESADLLYHLMILLSARDVSLADVAQLLKSRHKAS